MSLYSSSYPHSESKDPFFAPPLQADAPSPESFDSELDPEVDNEVGELDLNCLFDNFDDSDSTDRTSGATILDNIPDNPTPALTFWTDSSYENASSQYSYDHSPSVFSNLFEIETSFLANDGTYPIDDFIHLDMFSDSDYQQSAPAVDTVETQSDNGTPDLPSFVNMTPSEPSTVQQSASPVISAPVEPFKPFKCPQCPFCMSEPVGIYKWLTRLVASARKHNLKTHVKTHNKEDSDLFGCEICGRQLTRKHDLSRHYEKVHGDRMPSSSVSNHRFDPIPQFNRGKRWISSACPVSLPGLDPAADVPENIMAWYKELEACIEGV